MERFLDDGILAPHIAIYMYEGMGGGRRRRENNNDTDEDEKTRLIARCAYQSCCTIRKLTLTLQLCNFSRDDHQNAILFRMGAALGGSSPKACSSIGKTVGIRNFILLCQSTMSDSGIKTPTLSSFN